MKIVIEDQEAPRLPYVKSLWAFFSIDADGDEGLIASFFNGAWMPLVAADKARVESLRPLAEEVARESGKTVVLAKFSLREDVETFVIK